MRESRITDVYGAAQQRSSVDGPANDAVEIGGGFPQLVHFRHAAREVLKALWRAAAWQSLITTIQPGRHTVKPWFLNMSRLQ